jgi:hypothetical protein
MADQTPRPASDDTYNGWTNRETWAAHLWLTNTETLYRHATDAARRARAAGIEQAERLGFDVDENTGAGWFEEELGSVDDLAAMLTDARDGTPAGMLRDIGSTWRIDWREIYRALLEE